MLHRRRLTVRELAMLAGVGRCSLEQTLANVPGRGYQVRKKVAPLLQPAELSILGWTEDGGLEQKFHVERPHHD